ncbi:MAG: phosphodiester glycosidase family protein [Acidobacteriota bacterium]
MRRLTLLLAVWIAAALAAAPSATRPWIGVSLIERAETAPRPVRFHVVQIDLSAPGVRLEVSGPAGARETVRQTTVEFLRTRGAQLAVNAHFFLPFPSDDREAWVIGLAASNGRVYSGFELPEQRFALVPYAPALNIDPRNRARIVHHDPRGRDGRRVRERVRLWNAVSGSAQIVTEGRVTIPRYAGPDAPDGVLVAGAGYSAERSWYEVPNARTIVGLSRDGRRLTIFVVDRAGGSEGLKVGEAAAILADEYGVWNALNLDGGGSTSLAWENPATGAAEFLNQPAGGPAGRAVATSLAVFARRAPG